MILLRRTSQGVMHPICVCLLLILTCELEAAQDAMLVNINPKKVAHILDEHFVSLTINPTDLLQGRPFGANLESALKILQSLSPAYVRLGGPDTNHYTFRKPPSSSGEAESPDDIIITEDQWRSINDVAAVSGIGVIACLNGGRERGEGSKWDSRNALDLITFSDKEHFNITWELGYEYARDHNVSGEQIGKDIAQLRTVLNAFPRYQSSRLIGPDITSVVKKEDVDHVLSILAEGGPSLDAITWHPRWPHVGTIQPEDLSADGYEFPPDYLEWDNHQLSRILQRTLLKTPIWISQQASENTGSFAEGLILARRLALAARLGIEVVMKQPNLNDVTHPKPEYWVAVLHKKLLGRTTLDTRQFANESDVTIITHCTSGQFPRKKNGGISIYMVNTGSSPHKAIIRGAVNEKPEERVYQYVLTAGGNEDSIFTQATYLNGELLHLDDDGDIPIFTPKVKRLRHNMILKLPPYSVGFWVIPQAKVQVCRDEPHLPLIPLFDNSEVTKVLTTAQKGINDLRSMNQMIVNKLLPTIGIIPKKESTEEIAGSGSESSKEETKRYDREADLEEWENDLREQFDEINTIMNGEVRRRRQGGRSESAILMAEEKINNLARDLSRFLDRADQEREFGMFLEKAGLKRDFGKLMSDERLKKRRTTLYEDEDDSSEERRKRDNKPKQEDLSGLKNYRNHNNLFPKFKPHSHSLSNSGIEKINKELREDLLLREIVLLEKAEDTFADAIKNHKKSHESADKRIHNELSNLRDEKIATLLEMKYDSKPPPIEKMKQDINYMNYELPEKMHTLPILSKRLMELRSELAQQSHSKREAPQKGIETGVEESTKKGDLFDIFRKLLNKRREKQATIHEKITEMRNAKSKAKEPHSDEIKSSETTDTPVPYESVHSVTSPTLLKFTDKESFRTSKPSSHLKKPLVDSATNLAVQANTTESIISKIKSSLRKARTTSETSPIENDQLISEDRNKLESIPENVETADNRVNVVDSNGSEYVSLGQENTLQSKTKTSVDGMQKKGSSDYQEGGTTGFKATHEGNDFISSWENKVESAEFKEGSPIDRKSEKTNQAERSIEEEIPNFIEAVAAEYDASTSSDKPLPQGSSATPTKIEAVDKGRFRRDATFSETSRSNSTSSSSKGNGNGEGNSKNALVKKKKIANDTNAKPNDVLNLAGSTVEVVLDDVIPEAYDQAVIKLEHLVLPDYLKNLANVIEDLKILESIFKNLGGAAASSLTGSSNNIQKIDRKKREVDGMENMMTEKDLETTTVTNEGIPESEGLQFIKQNLELTTGSTKVKDDLNLKEEENLLTDSILHEVMEDVAEEVLENEEEKFAGSKVSSSKEALNNEGEKFPETKMLSSTVIETNSIESKSNISSSNKVSNKPPTTSEKKETQKEHNVDANSSEDPSTPWMSSTQDIIEHVILNLMRKQELEERKSKGKREVVSPDLIVQEPLNYKKAIGQSLPSSSSPMADSVNQFLRQLQPGVYVVPSKDMTNVRADQVARELVQSSPGKNSPNVVTLNIYYDKKNPEGNQEENSAVAAGGGSFKQPSVSVPDPTNLNQNYPTWPSNNGFKVALPAPHPLALPSALPAVEAPSPQPMFSPKQYENRYSRTFKPSLTSRTPAYAMNSVPSYEPTYQAQAQPKFDESYALISQEPTRGDYKLIPVSNFSPWTAKEVPLEDSIPEMKWNSVGYKPSSLTSDALPSYQPPSPRIEGSDRMWYQRKSVKPPTYMKKPVIKSSINKATVNTSHGKADKIRSIEPYWNRTLKEIFEETADEPFWNFLREPEEPYSNYKSAEDDLSNFMSGEASANTNGNSKDASNSGSRKKRSLIDNSISKLSKRAVPFMSRMPVNDFAGNTDTNSYGGVRVEPYSGGGALQPIDYYVTGRVVEFNGNPSRHRREQGRLSNDLAYQLKVPQQLPLDTGRISHGVLPRKMFNKPKEISSFEAEDQSYNFNSNIPSINLPALEQVEFKYQPSKSEVLNPFGVKAEDSPFQQFYDFGMQVLKSVSAYM